MNTNVVRGSIAAFLFAWLYVWKNSRTQEDLTKEEKQNILIESPISTCSRVERTWQKQEVKQPEKSQAKESPGAWLASAKWKKEKFQVQEEITKNQYLRAGEKKETHTYVKFKHQESIL